MQVIEIAQDKLGTCKVCGSPLVFDASASRERPNSSYNQAIVSLLCTNVACRRRYRLAVRLAARNESDGELAPFGWLPR